MANINKRLDQLEAELIPEILPTHYVWSDDTGETRHDRPPDEILKAHYWLKVAANGGVPDVYLCAAGRNDYDPARLSFLVDGNEVLNDH